MTHSPIDFTIAIPTYNGANRLPKVLKKIQEQVKTKKISWEILVIDNNSQDRTAQVVKGFQESWTLEIPLKYYFEPKQGLTFARQRAIQEASGQYVAFVDDDNLIASDWVSQAYYFGEKNPKAGAFSGQIHGEFEIKPPENCSKIHVYLAIREHGNEAFLFEPEKLFLPPGAGLVVRKQAWLESVPSQLKLIGRVGKVLVAGEDYESLLYLHRKGWKIWYNPQMHLNHFIPKQRLEKSYLLPLARGIGLATYELRSVTAKPRQKPVLFARTLLGNLRRIFLHLGKYQKEIDSNVIAAFELEFFLGSFLSPFYSLKNSLKSIHKM